MNPMHTTGDIAIVVIFACLILAVVVSIIHHQRASKANKEKK